MTGSDERVMTDYLLGRLDEPSCDQLDERLACDEAYFAQMAALDDDLILRWHQGALSAEERTAFAEAYSAPARQARVEDGRRLLGAARLHHEAPGCQIRGCASEATQTLPREWLKPDASPVRVCLHHYTLLAVIVHAPREEEVGR